jgi:hypothetical protein
MAAINSRDDRNTRDARYNRDDRNTRDTSNSRDKGTSGTRDFTLPENDVSRVLSTGM